VATTNHALRRKLTSDPDGPVGRDLRRRGLRVQNRARVLAPVDLGGLRASIVAEQQARRHPVGLVLAIGSPLKYALAVHEGSGSPYAPPSWKRGKQVPARRYLTNALPAAAG
jgi:hypothetical protein